MDRGLRENRLPINGVYIGSLLILSFLMAEGYAKLVQELKQAETSHDQTEWQNTLQGPGVPLLLF